MQTENAHRFADAVSDTTMLNKGQMPAAKINPKKNFRNMTDSALSIALLVICVLLLTANFLDIKNTHNRNG